MREPLSITLYVKASLLHNLDESFGEDSVLLGSSNKISYSCFISVQWSPLNRFMMPLFQYCTKLEGHIFQIYNSIIWYKIIYFKILGNIFLWHCILLPWSDTEWTPGIWEKLLYKAVLVHCSSNSLSPSSYKTRS